MTKRLPEKYMKKKGFQNSLSKIYQDQEPFQKQIFVCQTKTGCNTVNLMQKKLGGSFNSLRDFEKKNVSKKSFKN